MDWIQFTLLYIPIIGMFGSLIGFFLWGRSEARNDIRSIEAKLDNWNKSIQDEMKDFHGRLCSIEERYRLSKHNAVND